MNLLFGSALMAHGYGCMSFPHWARLNGAPVDHDSCTNDINWTSYAQLKNDTTRSFWVGMGLYFVVPAGDDWFKVRGAASPTCTRARVQRLQVGTDGAYTKHPGPRIRPQRSRAEALMEA